MGGKNVFAYLFAVALVCALAVVALAPQASAAGPAQQAGMNAAVGSVLIYSNNMAYVSSIGTADAPAAGRVALRLANFTNNALLGTLRASDADGSVYWVKRYSEEKQVQGAMRYLTFDELLNASYGKQITVKMAGREMNGTLLWVQGGKIGVQAADGSLIVAEPDMVGLPSGAQTREAGKNTTSYENGLEIYMDAAKAGNHTLALSYIETGAGWVPSYNLEISGSGTKGEGKLYARADVTNNAGEDWKGVVLRLAVGSPYFVEGGYYPSTQTYRNYAIENSAMPKAADAGMGTGSAPSFSGDSAGTQYIYTLSEPATIMKGESASLSLFDSSASYERDNLWEGYGSVQQVVRVKNGAGKPFAPGVMRVYDAGTFAGEASIDYTGEAREVEAKYAALPQVTVKKEENQSSDKPSSDRMVTTHSVSMNVQSSAKEAKPLTLRDYMAYGDMVELVSSSVPATQLPGNRLEWKLDVPSGANITIAYVYKTTSFVTPVVYAYGAPGKSG